MFARRMLICGLIPFLFISSACRFSGDRQVDLPKERASVETEISPPTRQAAGFTSPTFDISRLSPVIYPPVADYQSDCLQGPEPDWSAPSARLFVWRDPLSFPNRMLCIYGFPSSPDGGSFTVELTDPVGNLFVESFTLDGEFLVTASGGKQSYLPSAYEGVPYIGLPLFFGDPHTEGQWQVSAQSLDGTLVLAPMPITVEDVAGIFILSSPPGNPFDVFPLEVASDGQTAYIYLVGGQPDSEYVVALYTLDPGMAREFGLQPGEPVPYEILAISSLVPQFATVLNSDQHGIVQTQFNVDDSIPLGYYFAVAFPGVYADLEISLFPLLVIHD